MSLKTIGGKIKEGYKIKKITSILKGHKGDLPVNLCLQSVDRIAYFAPSFSQTLCHKRLYEKVASIRDSTAGNGQVLENTGISVSVRSKL
jgi:hypothetical protein